MSPDEELLERCRRFGTGVWSDAADEFGIDCVLTGLTQRSGRGRFAGFAQPVRIRTGPLGSIPLEELGLLSMSEQAAPGHVLVVEMLEGCISSAMGGIGAKTVAMRRAEAVIIDGACRDIDDIRATGLWVASRHLTPRTGKLRSGLLSTGEPATVGGVTIGAGDLIVGDATGIIAIPRDDIARVLAAAERVQNKDDRIERGIEAGRSLDDATNTALKTS
jgi:regulator of RNase E activity RraA